MKCQQCNSPLFESRDKQTNEMTYLCSNVNCRWQFTQHVDGTLDGFQLKNPNGYLMQLMITYHDQIDEPTMQDYQDNCHQLTEHQRKQYYQDEFSYLIDDLKQSEHEARVLVEKTPEQREALIKELKTLMINDQNIDGAKKRLRQYRQN